MDETRVYLLIREDHNEHGYIDTSVVGIYRKEADAAAEMEAQQQRARQGGIKVCGDSTAGWNDESDWEVYWKIESQMLK